MAARLLQSRVLQRSLGISRCGGGILLRLGHGKSVVRLGAPVASLRRPYLPQVHTARTMSQGTENHQESEEEVVDTVHVITNEEKISGPVEEYSFKAETRQLLDIVARSLYSEKEVFVREVISNSSDALEKLQYHIVTGKDIEETTLPLEINIATNEDVGTLTVQDYGVGMTKEELLDNLGTIARSGSKAFLEQLEEGAGTSTKENIIGQFGVGFYSTFMVADKVEVYTKSFVPGSKGYMWTSDGAGSFEIAEAEGITRGTKVIVHLKDDCKQFSLKTAIEEIIKKYSNFVGFPILVYGSCINTIQPVWMLEPNVITKEQHQEFYQFISKGFDKLRYTLHYRADAPVNIRSIFYFPESGPQQLNLQPMGGGVSLYSRKVLIQSRAEMVLPSWLRFVTGVVDSEDIPLNLSRELLQDSALIAKLRSVLTSRIVKFLRDQLKKDRVKYEKFFQSCGVFIREGVVTTEDADEKQNISKLLLFESSRENAGSLVSLPVYVERMKPTQKRIYYLCAPSRELAETSPYYETLKQNDIEVLFTYNEQDDIVLHYLKTFEGKQIMAAENYLTGAEENTTKDSVEKEALPESETLSDDKGTELASWMSAILGSDRVSSVKVSKRLSNTNHPAVVTVPDMVAAKHWLKLMKAEQNKSAEAMKYQILQITLEISPSHKVMMGLNDLRENNPDLGVLIVNQVFDSALISAGLMDDPRSMVGRLNQLLEKTVELAKETLPSSTPKSSVE